MFEFEESKKEKISRLWENTFEKSCFFYKYIDFELIKRNENFWYCSFCKKDTFQKICTKVSIIWKNKLSYKFYCLNHLKNYGDKN